MKNLIKVMLLVGVLSSSVMAKEDAYVITGCKDLIKNRDTSNNGYVQGIAVGQNMLGRDVLDKMEMKTFQGLDLIDIKKVCRRLLLDKSDFAIKYPRYSFSIMLRGELVRANGYAWSEKDARVKYMREKSGFEGNKSENKKY